MSASKIFSYVIVFVVILLVVKMVLDPKKPTTEPFAEIPAPIAERYNPIVESTGEKVDDLLAEVESFLREESEDAASSAVETAGNLAKHLGFHPSVDPKSNRFGGDGSGQPPLVSKPAICTGNSNPEFVNEFANFRSMTQLSSTQTEDMVDRITSLYLDPNSEEARRYPGKKISDVFDGVVHKDLMPGSDLRCVRMPTANEPVSGAQYMKDGFRGSSYVADRWMYDNERINNGGRIADGLYPNDLSFSEHQAL